MSDDGWDATDAGGNYRQSGCHGFDQRTSHAFIERRQHEQVHPCKTGFDVVPATQKMHGITEAGQFCLLQQCVMSISTTDDHKMQGGKVLLQLRNGCNQVFMAFNIGEPTDRSDDQCIRWTAEPFRLLFSLNPRYP